MKFCKLINELEMANIVSKCSVFNDFAESRKSEAISVVGDSFSCSKTNLLPWIVSDSKLIKSKDLDGLQSDNFFGGNITNKWAPLDMRPNDIGYLGRCMLRRSTNCLSNAGSIDQMCRLESKMFVNLIIDWA